MSHNSVRWYLFPRVCPVLYVSKEDTEFSFVNFGKTETLDVLSQLITENYDFPFERLNKELPPSSIPETRLECKAPQAASKIKLGGYRCSRFLPDTPAIPGITLILHDATTTSDWLLDTYMEEQRMKCWISIQGKPKRWTSKKDERNELRNPHSRLTNPQELIKILEELIVSGHSITHVSLRDIVLKRGEAIPPNTELYLQAITKLKPSSISITKTIFGVGLSALSYLENQAQCSFSLKGVEEKTANKLREFVKIHGPHVQEVTGNPKSASLIFMDAVPYGTHDLRAYLGEHSIPRFLTYQEHLRKYFIKPLRQILDEIPQDKSPCLALIVSLRELPAQPTIEPILLTLMTDEIFIKKVKIVGALLSKQRDYAAFLISINPKSSSCESYNWKTLFLNLYPELKSLTSNETEDVTEIPVITESRVVQKKGKTSRENWEDKCLAEINLASIVDLPKIPFQGPRQTPVFPSRNRISKILEEKVNPDTGDVVFTFGEADEPELIIEPSQDDVCEDPLLSKMIAGIKANMSSSST